MSILTLLSTADASWREGRPFLGGVLLIVAGLIVGYVPIQFTLDFIMMGNPFSAIGMLFAVLIFLTGVFALLRPDQSTNLGIAGVAFSILSVVGALGGLLVGLLIGIVGSNLLISWEPPARRSEEYPSATAPAGGEEGDWQEKIGGAGLSAPTAGSSSAPTTGESGQSFSWMDSHSSPTTQPDTTAMDTTTGRSGTTSESPFDEGDQGTYGADTGRTGPDTGQTGTDTGRTGTDTGRTGTDTGRTGTDTGPTGTGTGGTTGTDEGSVDFGWQDDPDAQSGSPQEDVGTGFQAERESTMDDEEDEDEDDDPVDFSWSDD